MLAESLGESRMFAIANRILDESADETPKSLKLHQVATLGLIRMSSQNSDGTSLLMLEGTERVKIEGICQEEPYPILRISRLPTTNRPRDDVEADIVVDLLKKLDLISDLIGPRGDQTAETCHAIDDLETLLHFSMQIYCRSSIMMQNTLEATDLLQRCKIVSDYLDLQIMLLQDDEE